MHHVQIFIHSVLFLTALGFVCTQQLVIALSNVTSLHNAAFWPRLNTVYRGASTLLRLLESYLLTIAKNMPQAQSGPFEAVSDGIGK